MKQLFCYGLLLINLCAEAQQPLIHAHNDYAQPKPLTNALHNKAYAIEADVYLVGDSLFVAHDKKDILTGHLFNTLYISPIAASYATHNGYIGTDTNYAPILVVDIKENSDGVIPHLVKLLMHHRSVFDRSVNIHAVQVVLSGDRGAIDAWHQWPAFILFDGRPYENYDSTVLHRVAFISDSYDGYSRPEDSTAVRLRRLSASVHTSGKLLRLWGIPDNPASWDRLLHLGIDIINTDKVTACREYFLQKK